MLRIFKRKRRAPQEIADLAQRILSGQDRGLDVDSYEHADLEDLRLKDLHITTLHFGLPEEWIRLEDAEKN
jgi:hypothetical protein